MHFSQQSSSCLEAWETELHHCLLLFCKELILLWSNSFITLILVGESVHIGVTLPQVSCMGYRLIPLKIKILGVHKVSIIVTLIMG